MSEQNLERVIKQIDALTPDNLAKLRRIVDEKLQAVAQGSQSPFIPRLVGQSANAPKDRSREQAWLEQHRDEYADQWVALDADRLLGHGASLKEAAAAAQQAGVSDALIVRVESRDTLPYVGV